MADGVVTFEFEFRNQRYKEAHVGLQAVARNIGLAMDPMGKALKEELRLFLVFTANQIADKNSGAWPGGTTSTTLSRRSGKSVRSIRQSPRVQGNTVATVQGSIGGLARLRTHEFGAVITAKKAKYLTIPLPAALNADGTPKKPNARAWSRTFVITSKKGNVLIVQRDGHRLIPLYVLKRSVKIPARLGMRKTLEAGVPMFADYAMAKMVERAVRDKFS